MSDMQITEFGHGVCGFALTESERDVLGMIFSSGALTQSQIAGATRLTQQSASRIVQRLSAAGFLIESNRVATGRRGYPSTTFKINAQAAFSFGFALRHRSVTVALINFVGDVVAERRTTFPVMTRISVISWLRETIASLRGEYLCVDATVAGIGAAISGSHLGDHTRSSYNTPYELDEWANIDLVTLLERELGLPVWTDNDGNLAALAEAKIGVGRRVENFAYIYIGAGVGGGIILDGELWRGRHGNAGEFAGGLPPNIYPFPNLELLRHIAARCGGSFESVDDMVEQFDPTWPAVDEWVASVRASLSIIVSNAAAILDLDLIVLGGEMPVALAERVIPHITLFDQKRRSQSRPAARVVPAETIGDAAAIGGAILPFQQCFFSRNRGGRVAVSQSTGSRDIV